jgi:hypothetical protein
MLDDRNPEQRKRGIVAANGWLEVADCVAAYCDLGITTGMAIGIVKAARLQKPIRLRWIIESTREIILETDQDA